MMQERFWGQLLEKSNEEFPLSRSISPKHQAWNGKGAGIGGVAYNYYIVNDWARIELYIDTASKERNKEIFESLLENRSEIEAKFGEELTWERLDGKRAYRIKKRVSDKGLTDEEQWDVTQERMVDAMISPSPSWFTSSAQKQISVINSTSELRLS